MGSCYSRFIRIKNQGMFKFACCFLIASTVYASPDIVERAENYYQKTDYAASLGLLNADPSPDAATYELTGKNYFMLGDYGKAIQFFEKAAAKAPKVSDYQLWLGRAYGRRAETENFLHAPGHASKARQYFENAIALDPKNTEAMNDLFDYYLSAPNFLGGGEEKAEAIARKIEHERPAEYQHELALLAEHKKQPAEALMHFRKAMELAPNDAGRVLDLAQYLAKLGRMEESDAYFAEAAKRWPNDPAVAFETAKTDIDHHRDKERSKELLQQYLKAQITPDDPSKQSAEKLLRQIASR